MTSNKVGIVILNFNSSGFLKYLLNSLIKAKTSVQFEVGVIDNKSEDKDAALAKGYFDAFLECGGKGFFIFSEKNLGFSGGNNLVIKQFLKDPQITHICMLNSDVLVTDYWLEYLTENDYDVTGPVTNATGNEQTVAVDYEVNLNDNAFETVNNFSHYRHKTYEKSAYESDALYFFNTVVRRRVIEKIGLLDERFYPGSYEDIDYCLRMKQAGFKQIIIRGCFVHHFGSGSFSKLDMPDRINISNVNRRRFEEKWNTHWEGDSWRMLQSCRQDMENFQNKPLDARSSALICKAIIATETLIKNWAAGIEWYQSDQYAENIVRQYMEKQGNQPVLAPTESGAKPVEEIQFNEVLQAAEIQPVLCVNKRYANTEDLSGKILLLLVMKKAEIRFYKVFGSSKYEKLKNKSYQFPGVPYPTLPVDMMSGKQMLKRAAKLLLIKIGLLKNQKSIPIQLTLSETEKDDDILGITTEQDSVLAELISDINTAAQKVCIQAPMFTKENERDGYIQRIKRVDEEIFDGYLRLYVYEDGKRQSQLQVHKIDDSHYFILYNSQDETQRKQIFALTERCGLMYTHSINRFMSDTVNVDMLQLLNNDRIKTIWDVHGAVPEEYLMYGSELGQEIANDVESFFYHHTDVIVVVNNAMRRHLERKHGETEAKFIVLPIFNIDITKRYEKAKETVRSNAKPEIVYAGGIQKWQNVELMQEIMEKTESEYSYKMFVPDPAAFNAIWKGKKPRGVIVDSKSPEELATEYSSCDYGLVLRDADVVNYVACPTKIIEYIQHGIVPILKSTAIGDFMELGMQYVDYRKCMNGELPTETARRRMVEQNFSILQKLHDSYKNGIIDLKKRIATNEVEET